MSWACDSPRSRIAGATALVTGANGGLGQAIVEALLRRGAARVYAAARQPPASTHPRVVPVVLDITDGSHVAAAAGLASDTVLLVNNAGVNRNRSVLHAGSLDDARAEMETNYFGTLSMCRAFAPVLARNGGGAIANVLSIAARTGIPAMGSLCASKAAALRMTECLRAELAAQRTHVVAFMPSALDTAMTRGLDIPKDSAAEAAAALLDGLEEGLDDVYFGRGAARINQALAREAARAHGVPGFATGL